MIINLISNLDETAKIGELYNFNQVVAWSLKEAFEKRGITTRFVRDILLEKGDIPLADHSIVLSAKGMVMIRASGQPEKRCHEKLRNATTGKMALYLDSDFGRWGKIFDCVFTLAKPQRLRPKYFYAGWGANPEFFYPEQDERALYIDSLMYGFYDNRFNPIYDIYKKMMEETDLTVIFPVPQYNKRHKKLYWPDIQKLIRKAHYYCCTQLGEGGLTRIESATCGALLVVPKELYRPKTMKTLEHKIWETEDELLDILTTETDVAAIRRTALEHSWDKVAGRMLTVFEGG